jgi:hypothetical protein
VGRVLPFIDVSIWHGEQRAFKKKEREKKKKKKRGEI